MIVRVDEENNAETWWTAARASTDAPEAIRPILSTGASRVVVPYAEDATVRAWCEALPGWNDGPAHAPHPLVLAKAGSKEPVTASGYYDHVDGSVGKYTWRGDRLDLDYVYPSKDAVPANPSDLEAQVAFERDIAEYNKDLA